MVGLRRRGGRRDGKQFVDHWEADERKMRDRQSEIRLRN